MAGGFVGESWAATAPAPPRVARTQRVRRLRSTRRSLMGFSRKGRRRNIVNAHESHMGEPKLHGLVILLEGQIAGHIHARLERRSVLCAGGRSRRLYSGGARVARAHLHPEPS